MSSSAAYSDDDALDECHHGVPFTEWCGECESEENEEYAAEADADEDDDYGYESNDGMEG